MRRFIFILFLIILYTQGIGVRLGIPIEFFKIVLFVLPVSFLLLRSKRLRMPPGFSIIVIYVIWSVLASLYHREGIIKGLLFAQYIIIGYLVLLGIYNSNFSPKTIRLINRYILALFFLQVGAALHEIFFQGRLEANVGTMTSGGGGPATTFPLFVFNFFFAAFLFLKKLKYLLLGALFFIVGYASGKLGVYFLIPMLATIGYLYYLILEKKPLVNKQSFKFLAVFALLAVIFTYILPSADSRTEGLNLDRLSPLERIEAFVSFSEEHNKGEVDSYSTSRQATSSRIIEETFKRDIDVFLFGQGFSAYQDISGMVGEGAYEKYRIYYGITGWSFDALVMGWPGFFFHVLFYYILFRKTLTVYKKTPLNSFGKTIAFICLLNFFTFLFNYFFYNINFTVGGWINYIHMYISALILAPQYRKYMTKNNEESQSQTLI